MIADIDKKPLLIVAGPTGCGKSAISVDIAKMIGAEIISADSVAVYKYLDIGSAKPTTEQMQGIRHHLVDILSPDEYFGVDRFVTLASEAIKEIYEKGSIPIIVGGTHFYIQALLYGIDFDTEGEHDDSFRNECYETASDEKGIMSLYERLLDVDPEYAHSVHPNNVKRVIRALEYHHYSGEKFSKYNEEQSKKTSDYNFVYTALNMERAALYQRIDKRVDMMIDSGLEDEVRSILGMGYDRNINSLSSIGYKEMIAYINGECDLEKAIEDIKKNSRHLAKRQLTWLKRENDVHIIDRDVCDDKNCAERIMELIHEKWIDQTVS